MNAMETSNGSSSSNGNGSIVDVKLQALYYGKFKAVRDTNLTIKRNTITALRFADKYADLMRVLLRSPAAEKLVQPLIAFGLAEGKRFFGGGDVPDDLVAFHFASSMMFQCGAAACWKRESGARTTLRYRRCRISHFLGS